MSNVIVPQGSQNALGCSVVILINTTSTPVIDLKGLALVGLKTPAALTGVAFTFTVCETADGTFVPLKTTASGTALSYTVAASGYYVIDPKDFAGVRFIKIVSGSTELAARTLLLSLKGI